MAAPTIATIVPASGIAWGRELVRISGTGFGPGAAVTFGGAAAEVFGVAEDFVDLRTPRSPLAAPGAVDVAVQNLDDDGEPVDGELVTEEDGFAFARADATTEGNLARLVRTLLQMLKQQVLAATGMDVAVDYDPDTDDEIRVIPVAETPALALAGPRARTNRFLTRRERRLDVVEGTGGVEFVRRAPAKTVDLEFSLVMTTRSKVQLLNLIECIGAWLQANPRVSMLADESDASSTRRWPLEHGEFRSSPRGPDDLRTATVDIMVLGFNLDEGRALDRSRIVETEIVGAEPIEEDEG